MAYLVGHHHTYKDVDGLDYQILLEADFLVNGDESNLTKEAIEKMKKNVFKTKTGIELLNHILNYKICYNESPWQGREKAM